MRTDALFLEPEANMGTRVQFSDMNLDDRLLKVRLVYITPFLLLYTGDSQVRLG